MNPRTQLAVAAAGVTLLSSTALHAVFLDTGWVAPVVGAVLAVLAGAELGSRLGQHLVARAVWRFVGSGLATLFYITAVWAHQGAVLGFIPRGHTWHLLRLTYAKAFTEVHDLATPAPTYRALMLLTATGVALVAIAVDQLSVRAPLIGLPLLALYSVPEWLSKDGTGWVPLALGGGGYVGLLIREGRDRTGRWGRTVTGSTTMGRNRSAAAAMSQAGWRIGAVALATALVVPPLIPDLGHFNLAKGGGVAPSAVVHYNLTANLAGSLHSTTKLPMYSYSASPPANSQGEYLRMAASDTFNSNGFTEPGPVADPGVDPTIDPLLTDGVSAPANAPTITTNIAVGPHFGQQELPIPVGTTLIENLQGRWSYEQVSATVFSTETDASKNQAYKTTSDVVNPTPQALENSGLTAADRANRAIDLVVPGNLPAKVATLARTVTAQAKAKTDYEKAVALQDWFTDPSNFRYSLDGPAGGKNYQALVAFLTTDRKGYCQQFSSAMAIMARTLGIPARVAFGFTTGVLRPGTLSTFDVDNQDAHAWPELYFSGLGWVRFEPTPRADQTIKPDYTMLGVTAIQNLGKPGTSITTTPRSPRTTDPHGAIPKGDPAQHQPGKIGGGSGGFSFPVSGDALVWTLVLVVLVLAAGSLPLLQARARRRRRRHDDDPRTVALLAWRETLRDAYDLGYVTSAADSPRQTARRLTESAALSNTAAGALHRLARGVELARYAPQAGDPRGLLFDAATVSAAMYGAAPLRARLRARTLPRSTTQAVAESMSRVSNRVSRRLNRILDRLVALTNRLPGRSKPSPSAARHVDHPEAKELVRR
jgi:hypothetical protein